MRARRENAPYRFLHRNSLKPYDHLIGLELPDVVAAAVKTLRHKKGRHLYWSSLYWWCARWLGTSYKEANIKDMCKAFSQS
jgi:hypothetical protein